MFKQDPYKGDVHTKNSYGIAWMLESTQVLVDGVKWRMRGTPGRISAQKLVPTTNPQIDQHVGLHQPERYPEEPGGPPDHQKVAGVGGRHL